MRTRTFFPTVFLLSFSLSVSAQKRIPLLNSGELLQQGFKLHDTKKYKEAIAVYQQINRSDSNYSKALYEMSYSSYMDSNFVDSKKYAELGLALFPNEATQWYLQLANAEDDMGNREKAIDYYNKVLDKNKNDYLSWFNKGLTYYKMDKKEEAKKSFQQCLMIYPYQSSAHYYLGAIAYEEGKPVPAMLSLCAALIANPESRYNVRSITYLRSISEVKDDIVKNIKKAKKSKDDDFEVVQEILLSKAALDKDYKLKTSLEDHITRQLQVVLEKLEYSSTDNGFWMQYYVPMFKQIFEKNKFEAFSYYIFSDLNNKTIKDYINKNKKSIDEVVNIAVTYLDNIRQTQTLMAEKRANVPIKFSYNNKSVTSKGNWEMVGKDYKLMGPWEFYHPNGQISSKGNYSNDGKREGEWLFYHDNGQLKEKTSYQNGLATGETNTWFDNGVQSSKSTYKDGELNGTTTRWFYNGVLRRTENYSKDKKNGKYTSYNSYGIMDYEGLYKDDIEDGVFTNYYENGKVQSTINYTAGKTNGMFKRYHENGKLAIQGELVNDKKNGTWKEFYDNGKVKTEYAYDNGEIQGEGKEYHENGKLSQTSSYAKGKIEGKVEDFDEDGKIYCESSYEKGRLREIKFLDKQGNVVSNTTTRRGAANLVFYNVYGNKVSEGYFTKEGQRNGKTVYYHSNGNISSEAEFKEGLLQGNKKNYFLNGKLSDEVNYTSDEQDGYYISYHPNGKVKHEGWFVNGKKQGDHADYDKLGNMHNKAYYLDGDNQGYFEYYHPNGKIDFEQRYDNGWVVQLTQFDTTGKVIENISMPKGEGSFTLKHFNGKPYATGSYKHFHLHGPYKFFFFDGSASASYNYNQGNYDGEYKTFFYGGQTKAEGKYSKGNKIGTWKYYYGNGKLFYVDNYDEHGLLNGQSVMYNHDGTTDKEINYVDGEYEGTYKQFGENGQLAYQLNYHKSRIQSYTYEGKDGKLVPAVPVKNGTFKLLTYYKNGTKSAESDFLENNINGMRKIFFSTGKPYVDGARILGNEDGIKKVYYPNGNIEKEENYIDDELHGTAKNYHPNGKLKSEEEYYLGELHGVSKYYDESGKLKETRIYFYDILQEVKK